MKFLQDYMNEKQTALLKKYGVFFAFSANQYQEGAVEGVEYVPLPAGMIVPKEHVSVVLRELDEIYTDAVKQDLADHGAERIIRRELNNHECYYTGDVTDCVEKLADYPGIDRAAVVAVYNAERTRLAVCEEG